MSFRDYWFDQFLAPWFTIDGITYNILDVVFLSLPFCMLAGIIVTWLDHRRKS